MKYRYLSHHCLFTLCKSRVTTLPINIYIVIFTYHTFLPTSHSSCKLRVTTLPISILNCHFYLPHILMCPHKTWWYIFFALKEVVITWKEHAILTLSFYAPGNLIFKCYVGLNFPLDSFMWCLQSMLLLAIKITFGKYSNNIPKNDF